jgi:hypothetical protein
LTPGFIGSKDAMSAYRDFAGSATGIPVLNNVGLNAGRSHPESETRHFVIPNEDLFFSGIGCVHHPLSDFRHGLFSFLGKHSAEYFEPKFFIPDTFSVFFREAYGKHQEVK